MSLQIKSINGTIEKLRKEFNSNQMSAIEYAIFNLDKEQAQSLIDKRIPAYYMEVYAFLMKQGISVDRFIAESYHTDEIRCKEIDKKYMQTRFDKKIAQLENNGMYSEPQITALKEAFVSIGEDVFCLFDCSIPAEFITKYAALINNGIMVDTFIINGYHLTEEGKEEINNLYNNIPSKNEAKQKIIKPIKHSA